MRKTLLKEENKSQPSMLARGVLFLRQRNLNFELLNSFSLPFPPQYWLSRKHEGPKGREGGREGGQGVNQTKASLLSRLGKFGARDGEILDSGARL